MVQSNTFKSILVGSLPRETAVGCALTVVVLFPFLTHTKLRTYWWQTCSHCVQEPSVNHYKAFCCLTSCKQARAVKGFEHLFNIPTISPNTCQLPFKECRKKPLYNVPKKKFRKKNIGNGRRRCKLLTTPYKVFIRPNFVEKGIISFYLGRLW